MTSSKKDKEPYNTLSKRDKEKEKTIKERFAIAAPTERLKTVVRRLPPNLPEVVFWQTVQQWVSDETVTWKVFYPGKVKKKVNKENIPSRAYIAFKDEKNLAQFSREYDGHVFRDKQGNESQAVVEFSPYQKVPIEKKKVDARNATIEKDEDYISFIASLNELANAEPVSIEALIAATQPPPMPKTTPLLEALKAEKSANKDREAILRNHAHYKDPTILSSTSIPRNLPATSAATRGDTAGKKKAPQQKEAESGKKSKKAQAAAAKQQQGQQPQQPQQATASTSFKKKPPSPKATKTAAAVTQAQALTKPLELSPVSATSSGEGCGTTASTVGGVAAQVGAAATASRRGRPIVGLASRHLQAALSQVGAAAVERKRREREAAKEDTSPRASEADNSPRRDRSKKKEKGGQQPDGAVRVPSIMQRPEGVPPPSLQQTSTGPKLPSPAQVQTQAVASGSNAAGAPSASGATGVPPPRSGYGRGRGRGRGGPRGG